MPYGNKRECIQVCTERGLMMSVRHIIRFMLDVWALILMFRLTVSCGNADVLAVMFVVGILILRDIVSDWGEV